METEEVTAEMNDNKETSSSTDIQNHVTENSDEKAATKVDGESFKVMDNPACDWLEPLEEDCDDADADSFDQDGTGNAELESLAGSEWSGTVPSSRKNGVETGGRGGGVIRKRRSNHNADENWLDCPVLGQGWKRKQVFRRSGTSEGRSDTYYMGPAGQKVRSRVELLKHVDQSLDLTKFDFKSGTLYNDGKRRRMKRLSTYVSQKVEDTKTTSPKMSPNIYPVTDATQTTQPQVEPTAVPATPAASLLGDSLSGSTNGLVNGGGKPLRGICKRCNKSFTVEQGQSTCQNCRKELNIQIKRRRSPYRKWVPCGRCRACKVTVDCGKCVSCRNGRIRLRLNAHSRKVIKCRKRKCLHPISKDRTPKVNPQISEEHFSKTGPRETSPRDTGPRDTSSGHLKPSVSDFEESQYSDSEDLSVFGNDDDKDEIAMAKMRRRSCGTCRGCERRTDCGTCDFCMDKPKFGGSNRKRQKCRLRQCQREAMKHLLPMGESQEGMAVPQDWINQDGQRMRRRRKSQDFDVSDNEAEQYRRPKAHMGNKNRHLSSYNGKRPDVHHKGLSAARCESLTFPTNHAEENFRQEKRSKYSTYQEEQQESVSSPSITQIFSMADSTTKGIDADHELMPLLKSLRNMVLPVLWFCIVVEGPQLQLMQCSKRSPMADTVVNIEPGFQYHISVQGQPLLPTHKLYDIHPPRLTTTAEVVALLEDLERHSICQGFDNKDSPLGSEPVLPERAATCDFLISKESERCAKCSKQKSRQA